MSENTLIISIIIGVIMIIGALILIILKLNKKEMKKIIQTKCPMWVELYDVLVFQIYVVDNIQNVLLPVLKDKKENNFYIPSRYGNYGYLKLSLESKLSSIPKVIIKNIKNEIIELNKEGRIYIEKEKSKIKINDDIINIDGYKLKYKGILNEYPKLNKIYSLKNNDILQQINNAKIYYGILDFDIEGILIEHLNN